MTNILFNLSDAELEQYLDSIGQPRFRAKQIAEWLNRGAPDFSVMKNLPTALRNDLDAAARTLPVRIIKQLESSDGQTTKFLLELNDSAQIECVLMRTSYGNSVCISSQAGCAMGCKFCASTLLGLKRNLTADEMFAQVLVAQWELNAGANVNPPKGDVSHVVVMGTGEPLQNTENLIVFTERLHHQLGIGWRRITVSTCGIVPGINELTKWGQPVNLAISLHAPNDVLRGKLMPINNRHKIAEVLDAAWEFEAKHHRQIMIEYILLESTDADSYKLKDKTGAGLSTNNLTSLCATNCLPEHAFELAELLKNKNVMVNLIPWNAVGERDFASPSGNTVHRFQDILIKNGIHTRIRRERGTDIGSACGQLRLNSEK